MAEAGVSQETRMKLTGHSSISINTKYTHLGNKQLEDAVAKLPVLLSYVEPEKTEKFNNELDS
jgi:hypothetical protein